jgi:hypothetical protein
MTSKTRQVLNRLAKQGVVGTFVSDISEETDGEIRITPTVVVQVGWDYVAGATYLIVVVANSGTEPTTWRHYPTRGSRDLPFTIEDIAMAQLYDFNAEPVLKRVDSTWQVEVYRGPNGGSIIERWRAPKGIKPRMWVSERSPEDWVSLQPDHAKYSRAQVAA